MIGCGGLEDAGPAHEDDDVRIGSSRGLAHGPIQLRRSAGPGVAGDAVHIPHGNVGRLDAHRLQQVPHRRRRGRLPAAMRLVRNPEEDLLDAMGGLNQAQTKPGSHGPSGTRSHAVDGGRALNGGAGPSGA